MLKLLLVTLGTWSGVSVFLVGALGFLIYLREQRACAVNGSTGAKLPGAAGRVSTIARTR
jgi:nitrate reductase NapE component